MLSILNFEREKIATITDYTDLEIEENLENGDQSVSFKYLGSTIIKNEYYVATNEARFTIKEASPGEDAATYRGQLDLEDLQRTPFKRFTSAEQTLTATAAAALSGTGWRVETSITTKRNVQLFKALPLDILYAIRDAWMCEIRFDNVNKIVYFEDAFGEDRGVYFIRGINLKESSNNIDSYDYVTRIIPYGEDGLTIEDVNDGIPYVENYQYSTKILTLIWEDTSYTDAEALKEDAAKKLEDLSKPKRSYDCDIIDLAKMSEKYGILDFKLGDKVKIIDELTGTNDTQRIVRITKHPDEPESNSCELSNTVLTFEEIQAKMSAAADAWDDISNSDGTINGVYVRGVQAGDVVGIETVITNNATVQGAVTNVKVLYAQGDSPTEPPETGWSTQAPEWDSGKHQWQKTVMTYASGETETTAETNITGAKGDDGDEGISVVSTVKYYKLQPEGDAAPSKPVEAAPAGWVTTEPAYNAGMVLYTCDKTVFSDESFSYSDVSLSSSYAAVSQLAESDYRYSHTYTENGDLWTFTATLTHAGVDITDTELPERFLWYKKDQSGLTLLGTGKTITVDTSGFELGGAVVGVYTNDIEEITLTGETVTFDGTGFVSFKSIVAEIKPSQSGSGDPSPNNMRAIKSYSANNLYVSDGENATSQKTYTSNWASSAGAVYGGSLEIVSGELTSDMKNDRVTASWLESIKDSRMGYAESVGVFNNSAGVYIRNWNYNLAKTRCAGGIKALCNAFPVSMHDTRTISTQSRLYFKVDETITSVDDFINKIYEIENSGDYLAVCFELAEPATYQLEPLYLEPLVGTNTMWTDTGNITVTYANKSEGAS